MLGRRRFIAGSAAALALPASLRAAVEADAVLGELGTHVTRAEDTLLDIARQYDLGFVELRAANPAIDPWLPGPGRRLILPTAHVLPAVPRRGIAINLAEMRLYAFLGRGAPLTFPVGIGREGAATPTGTTQVARKTMWPSWRPTPADLAEDPDVAPYIPPGPDNPMGIHAIYLGWVHYAIHDTNKPDSVGRRSSNGCIRLYLEDAVALYPLVAPGTPVRVVHEPVKTGWRDGELWLEVHPTMDEADEIERTGRSSAPPLHSAEAQVAEAAGRELGRVDWYRVGLTALERSGVPVRVTR